MKVVYQTLLGDVTNRRDDGFYPTLISLLVTTAEQHMVGGLDDEGNLGMRLGLRLDTVHLYLPPATARRLARDLEAKADEVELAFPRRAAEGS